MNNKEQIINVDSEKKGMNQSEIEKVQKQYDKVEKQMDVQKNNANILEKILNDDISYVKQYSVLDVQEKERQRIARDLHDTSLQSLAYLVYKVELVSLYMDKDPVKAKLELAGFKNDIKRVIDEIRNYIFDMRPMSFDDLGIRETLEKLFNMLNPDDKFIIEYEIDDLKNESKNPQINLFLITIYRIIQECIQNAIQHSEGTKIYVSLKKMNDKYEIIVKDNGKGFNIKEAFHKDKHFGLSVLHERVFLLNGEININTAHGTSITIEIPIKENNNIHGENN